ncbi:PIN domain-containing protein [Nocardioides humilatus]|uniref:PIN domain-containing protein n=1 Tax=Nocardioides humilatus TaxID=2607660 RepID=A0A5B1LHY2_9ACTN|nr:PIN domain-containing protein [Nocardioides humilatus]KAA1420263.1 PIN domain-containing protein [Nocardioides humilatus]
MRKPGLSLDAGALIAVERGNRGVRQAIEDALSSRRRIHVTPGVVAQVWRDGARQAVVARLLDSPGVTLLDLTSDTAKILGEMVAASGHADIIDVHVALDARQHGHIVMTSDPDDIRAVDPSLTIIEV